jgi:hypothetical protein
MLGRVALVRIDVSDERSASFTKVARIAELGTLSLTTHSRCEVFRSIYSQRASVASYC